ncbi:MAG: hypothetical protein ACI9LM_001996 [Alteromonadaceae bacterium]
MNFIFNVIIVLLITSSSTANSADKSLVIKGLPVGFTSLIAGDIQTHWQGLLAEPYDKPHQRKLLSSVEKVQEQILANKIMSAHWRIEDDVLYFDGNGTSLVTKKHHDDFELYLDWRIEKNGDSGVYLRGLPQVQIWDPDNPEVEQHGAEKGSGGLWNNTNLGKFPLVKADKPVGQWNQFYIKMIADKVTVYLNGTLVVDQQVLQNLWQPKESIPQQEQIELQVHGHAVQWRNIYIKELN